MKYYIYWRIIWVSAKILDFFDKILKLSTIYSKKSHKSNKKIIKKKNNFNMLFVENCLILS